MGARCQLTILGCGTSTGVPVPGCECAVCRSDNPKNRRLRVSAMIAGPFSGTTNRAPLSDADSREPEFVYLLDTGADLRQQMLRHRVKRIDGVLFTHSHADHILGLDDLRPFNFRMRRSIPCYGTPDTLSGVRRVFHYIFDPDPEYLGGMLPQVELREIGYGSAIAVGPLSFLPFRLPHGNGFVTGYRCGELGYATDCHEIPDDALTALRGVRYLVLDGLRYEDHGSHLTIPKAIDYARRIGAERTILIHMTHSIDYDEVSGNLPAGVELAFDGLTLDFQS